MRNAGVRALAALLCMPAQAGIFDLDLELLQQVPVSLAARRPVALRNSPAVVNTLARDEWQALGIETLGELVEQIPGYGRYRVLGEQVFINRGQRVDSWNNNHTLLLIDGVPFFHARVGKAMTEFDLPLGLFERAELLRGQAFAIYGTEAFQGAMQLQSPRCELLTACERAELRLGLGSPGRARLAQGSWLGRAGGGELLMQGSLYQQGLLGRHLSSFGDAYDLDRDNQDASFVQLRQRWLSGPLAGWQLGLLASDKRSGLGEEGLFTTPVNRNRWSVWQPYLRHLGALADWQSELLLRHNRSVDAGRYSPYGRSDTDRQRFWDSDYGAFHTITDDSHGQLQLSRALAGGVLRVGADLEARVNRVRLGGYRADTGPQPWTSLVPVHTRRRALFVQWDGELPWGGLQAIAALRHDAGGSDGPERHSAWAPRLALLKPFAGGWSLRVQAGEALRLPTVFEYGFNNERRADAPASGFALLLPERMRSLDLSLSRTQGALGLQVGVFCNHTRDQIQRGAPGGPVPVGVFYNRLGETRASGLEAELRWRPLPGLDLRVQASRSRAEGPDGQPLPDLPRWLGSGSLVWQVQRPWLDELGLVLRGNGAWRGALQGQDAAASQAAFDLQAAWRLAPSARLRLQGLRLLGEGARYPLEGRDHALLPSRQWRLVLELTPR